MDSSSPHMLNKHGRTWSPLTPSIHCSGPLELLFARSILLFGEVCKSRRVVLQCMGLWHVIVLYNGTHGSKKAGSCKFLACKYMKCVTLAVLLVTIGVAGFLSTVWIRPWSKTRRRYKIFLLVLIIWTLMQISYHWLQCEEFQGRRYPKQLCLLKI